MTYSTTARSPAPGGWCLENSYAQLPSVLYVDALPSVAPAPKLVVLNRELAVALGLDPDALENDAADFFSGKRLPPGARPIAQAYAGHQYGHLTMLGDGRALLLGEQITPDGRRFDLQLKGSGRTVFSRNGDGKAVLGPMLREFLIGEAMTALGIPATRALAVVATGEEVWREAPLPGAVLARVAASHLRVGTFEFAARCGEPSALQALIQYTLQRHYPDATDADSPALALLEKVVQGQAQLVARWMAVGFVHGVMNTDNTSIACETLDFGPCAFIDAYDPDAVFSSIDHYGRYAFGRQPFIIRWNLARFAEALLSMIGPGGQESVDLANSALEAFQGIYDAAWGKEMRLKLGLPEGAEEEAVELARDLLGWMHRHRADFTATFRALCDPDFEKFLPPAAQGTDFQAWRARHAKLAFAEPGSAERVCAQMRLVNPAIIPRNHHVDAALKSAEREGNMKPFHRLLDALKNPFASLEERSDFCTPPPPDAPRIVTYCGT
jgi:uncharacterized protein YdiU (UPF0061 family)